MRITRAALKKLLSHSQLSEIKRQTKKLEIDTTKKMDDFSNIIGLNMSRHPGKSMVGGRL